MVPVRVSNLARNLVLLSSVLIASFGCASEFEQKLVAAERLRVEASEAGAEWLRTGSLLEQAQEAQARGDLDAASELLAKARFEAETAIKQADYEAGAWASRVVQ